jgi:hypothetical protein
MRSKLILSVITFFIISSTFAQGVKFGIKAGASINKITGKSFTEQFTFGYHAGAFVTINLSKKIGIQPEVIFNQVNQDTASSFNSLYQFNNIDKIKLSYLSMPILLNYYFNKYLALQVGPQFSLLLDQNVSLVQNGKDAFKKGDISAVGGLQLNILKFRAYARYLLGLNNVNDVSTADSWKNQSIQLGVGFSFK